MLPFSLFLLLGSLLRFGFEELGDLLVLLLFAVYCSYVDVVRWCSEVLADRFLVLWFLVFFLDLSD